MSLLTLRTFVAYKKGENLPATQTGAHSGLDSQHRQDSFLFCKTLWLALGHTDRPTDSVLGGAISAFSGWDLNLTEVKMGGTMRLLPPMPS